MCGHIIIVVWCATLKLSIMVVVTQWNDSSHSLNVAFYNHNCLILYLAKKLCDGFGGCQHAHMKQHVYSILAKRLI